jgi:hypothetical protein
VSPTIHAVKAKHEKQLLARPGVVSVGVGLDSRGGPAIIVGLDAPREDTLEALPAKLDGYPVVTEVTGPLRAR